MPRFVGRAHELARLTQLLGSGQRVLLLGIPGVGKRSLVAALRERHPEVAADAIVVADRWPAGWNGAVLRLGGLSREDARALWEALDAARGGLVGFTSAYARSGGHPAALIALHGDGDATDGRRAWLREAFDPAQRHALLALALHGGPAPVELIDDQGALGAALALEPIGVGWVTVSPLIVGPLVRFASPEELAAARRDSAALTAEVARRLGDAEVVRALGARLAERCIAALPAERRSTALRLARARLLVELLDVRRALAIVEDLPGGEEVDRLRAELLLRAGRIDDAGALLERLAEPELAAVLAVLRGEPGAEVTRRVRLWAAWYRRQDDDPELGLDGVSVDDPLDLMLFAGIAAARRGELELAREILDKLREVAAAQGTPRRELVARLLAGHIDAAAGDRLRAAEELTTIASRLAGGGELPFALGVRLEAAALLHTLGRAHEASDIILAVERRARQLGLRAGLLPAIDRAASETLLRSVWHHRRPGADAGPARHLRRRAVLALQAAYSGEETRAEVELAALAAEVPRTRDFAVERTIAAVARAMLARLRGDDGATARQLAEATRAAGAGGLDAEQLDGLARLVRRERLVSTTRRRLALGSGELLAAGGLVIDSVRHEIRGPLLDGVTSISLERRPVLARLLYALAARPTEELDKDVITMVLWGVPYNPLVHDNAIKANVHRLNRMIAPAGITVRFGAGGYKIHGPDGLVFVDRPLEVAVPPFHGAAGSEAVD